MIRKIQYSTFGSPEVLQMAEVEEPVPGKGKVRLAVKAAGLNPLELKTFQGYMPLRIAEMGNLLRHPWWWFGGGPARFPKGVGRDFAGVVDAVGPGVSNFAVGDAVLGTLRGAPGTEMGRGSLVEKLVVPAKRLVAKPEGMEFETAASLGVAAETSCGAFRKLDLKPEDVLVISGASGGVGSLAVQLAVQRGATVLGIASAKNAKYVRSLGAIPVAYGDGLKERLVKAAPSPITKFFDCYGGDYVALGRELDVPGSAIGTLVPGPKPVLQGAKITGARHARPGDLLQVAQAVASGNVKVALAGLYPFALEPVRDAYEKLAGGHVRGKLVVTFA